MLGAPFYTPVNEGNIAPHSSGNYAFYSICGAGKLKKIEGCEIYQVHYDRIQGKWFAKSKVSEIATYPHAPKDYKKAAVGAEIYDSHPAFAKNGKIIFFSSKRKGGMGGSDIWYSILQPSGLWSAPKNAGARINSVYDEIYPQPAPDNSYLVFASNRPGGYGGYDLYRAYTSDTFASFTATEKMPMPLNSSADDWTFIWLLQDSLGYLSSNRSKSYGKTGAENAKGGDDLWEVAYRKPQKGKIQFNITVWQQNNHKYPLNIPIQILHQRQSEVIDTTLYYQPEKANQWLTDCAGNFYFTINHYPFFADTVFISSESIPQDTLLKFDVRLRIQNHLECQIHFSPDSILNSPVYIKQYQWQKQSGFIELDSLRLAVNDSSAKLYFPTQEPYLLALYINHQKYWDTLYLPEGSGVSGNCAIVLPPWDGLLSRSKETVLHFRDRINQNLIKNCKVQIHRYSGSQWEMIYSNSDAEDNNGIISLPNLAAGSKYRVQASAPSYLFTDTLLIESSDKKKHLHTILLDTFSLEKKYLLRYIYFPLDSWEITQSSQLALENLLILIRANPELNIHLIAHTDTRGPKQYNELLSLNRARACQDFLVKKGIPIQRIIIEGKGDQEPLIKEEKTEEDYQKNRRLEFILK